MPSKVWYRVPTPGDVLHVARNMREMDAREIFLMLDGLDRDTFAAVTSTMVPRARVALGVGLDGAPFCAAVLVICSTESSPWFASASLFATADFPRLAFWLVRHVRKVIIPALLADGVRRVECRALAGYVESRRFLRAAGAVEETILTDHGPGSETYVLCAWRRSDFVKESADVL
jgi:hypothetical protein